MRSFDSLRSLRMTGWGCRTLHLLPCHPERSGEGKAKAAQSNGSCAQAHRRTNAFLPCSERLTVLYKIPPLASLGRDDRGGVNILQTIQNFTFYTLHFTFTTRSFDARGHSPRLLRMTGGGARRRARAAPALAQDDKGGVNILQYIRNFTFTILHFTFSCPGGGEAGRRRRARRCTVPPSPPW